MLPTFVGYFPKRTSSAPASVTPANVVEIASVSDCISKGPSDWLKHWLHNDWGFFDSVDVAKRVIPAHGRAAYDLYAYELFPVRYVEGIEEAFVIGPPDATPLDSSFEPLGYDVVTKTEGTSQFECSPLSCNGLAKDERVNRYCLADGFEAARELAASCEARGCEPGPYYVVRVWREVDRTSALARQLPFSTTA